MSAEIPDKEVLKFYAGDTVKWTRDFADYPASTWTLSYSFRRNGGDGVAVDIESTADGDTHSITIPIATTETFIPGIYRGIGYVLNDGETERWTVWQGDIEVLANIADAADGFDGRTKAEKILDFIDRSFERVAAKQVVQSNIEGVSLQFRTYDDLIKARNYWATIVAQEKMRKANTGSGGMIHARFTIPT